MTCEFCAPKPETDMLIHVVLDESGSMGVKQNEVIQGFNSFVEEQRAKGNKARLCLTRFNTNVGYTTASAPLTDVKPLDVETYKPNGWTALYDAVGLALGQAKVAQRSGEKVLVLIITDGQENHSKNFTLRQIADKIQDAQNHGWAVLYIGPNPDQWAQQTGTLYGNTIAYDSADPKRSFAVASMGTTSYAGYQVINTAPDLNIRNDVKVTAGTA